MRLIGVMLVCVGCHEVGGTMPPDAAIDPDGPARSLGMYVTWNANPALPGDVTDKVTVTDVNFQLDHLQLVSDAGADERTTHSRYQLHWNAMMTPVREEFPDAPVAVYQKISLDMRPGFPLPFTYQIQGTWQDDGDNARPFKIIDVDQESIPIDCSVMLPAGGSVSIAIRVDLKDALNNINFKNIMPTNGVLVVGGQQLMDFHDRLARAFKLDN
jgi:hypothetical protein